MTVSLRLRNVVTTLLVVVGACLIVPDRWMPGGIANDQSTAATYQSPFGVAVSPDGKTLFVTNTTARSVALVDIGSQTKAKEVALQGQPRGLCLSPDGGRLYVAERDAGTIAVIDTATAAVTGRIPVGKWPVAVALSPQSKRLYACNQDNHTVSVIDLSQSPGAVVKNIGVVREPSCVAITPDERFVVVTNQIPLGVTTEPTLAADVTIIDAAKLDVCATVRLPSGSTVVNGVTTSPDGKWAYVVHGLGHFNLPMTQLERGWVNTYALTIIDIPAGTQFATVLLDDLTQGAADPFAVVGSKDGGRLWISHSGGHEISIVAISALHELLGGKVSESLAALQDGSLPNIWVRIQKDRSLIQELAQDLTALYIADAIRKVPSGGNGPRGIALAPDGKTLYVANYYSGTVAVLNADTGQQQGTIALGVQPEPDSVRRGEILFHDATRSFQHWHSCASCHPNDGRIDGLRWDFADDGLGNGMNTLSILLPDKTEPLHRLGTLATARVAAEHGLTFTHMIVPTKQHVDDLLAYLTSLRPERSPHLAPDGNFTEAAARGKGVFEGKAQCATCHPAPYFSDQKLYNVGVTTPHQPDAKYKSTALLELYRTAPYLHDGRALTLDDVLTKHNPDDQHGKTKGLTKQEIDDLIAYLMSL